MRRAALFAAFALAFSGLPAAAQPSEMPSPYGAPIALADADRVVAGAEAEARRNNWAVAIAVVDSGGHLVAFKRMDGVGTAVVDIALGKARTASSMRQPSGNLEGWAAASSAPVAIPGIMPFRGGVPISIDGRIVGGVGVSGVTSEQDEQVANAGLAALSRRER